MSENMNTPELVLKVFPQLATATFIRRFAAPIPLVPDTTFDIYMTQEKEFFALVTTDYADPSMQSQELKKISGQHEFEFEYLLKPYDNSKAIKISDHNEMPGNFFVYENQTYFYVARLVNIE